MVTVIVWLYKKVLTKSLMSKIYYSNYYCYFNLWRVASVLFNIQQSSIDLLSFELLNTLKVCVLSRLNPIIRPIYNVKGEVLISRWDNAFLQRNLVISIINFYLTPVYLIGECNVVMGVTIDSHDEWQMFWMYLRIV